MIFEEAKVKTEGLHHMHIFLACFKAKLHPSCHGGGGKIEEKSKGNMGAEGPWSKDKIAISAYASKKVMLEAPPNL